MGTAPVHPIAARLAITTAHIAAAGVPCSLFTRCIRSANGMPWSRAREYTARDAEVTQDRPQNHIAMEASAAIALPNFAPSAVWRIAMAAGTGLPSASLALSTSGIERIARVKAINSR